MNSYPDNHSSNLNREESATVEMYESLRGATPLALVLIVLTMISSTAPAAAADDTVEDVVKAWQARQQQFETVRFHISGTHFQPAGYLQIYSDKKGEPDHPFPSSDHSRAIESKVLLDFTNERIRRHNFGEQSIKSLSGNDFVTFPLDEITVFTGTNFKSFEPMDLNLSKLQGRNAIKTELTIYKKHPFRVAFSIEHNPLLYACGIVHVNLNFDASKLRPAIVPKDFRIVGESQFEEHACFILRTVPDSMKHYFEFWVDGADPRMIRQVHGFNLHGEGKLWITTKIQYQDTEHGPMPESWTIDRFESSTNKVATYTMKLDEFEINPTVTDSDFDIDPPPGTRVYDDRRPDDSREYVVADPGKPNLPIGEHILQEEQKQSRFWLTSGILGVLVLLGGAVFLYRRQANAA